MEHTPMMQDVLHFDGALHLCTLIAVSSFLIRAGVGVGARAHPLRCLAKLASSMTDGNLPSFKTPSRGIPEIEQLRRSLVEMTSRIQAGQEREAAYRNALADSQEQERTRIAQEIHDEAIQCS